MALTANELVEKGQYLADKGNLVIFLYPSQEWMALKVQMPYLRYEKIPTKAK